MSHGSTAGGRGRSSPDDLAARRGDSRSPHRRPIQRLSQLGSDIAQTTASDVALVVSRLVTNSVLHANVGPARS
jgi:hypothetical protein